MKRKTEHFHIETDMSTQPRDRPEPGGSVSRKVVSLPLPDGSMAVIEPIDENSSLVSRYVDGECTWGQAFAVLDPGSSRFGSHDEQLADILNGMESNPGGFVRPWDSQGRSR